MTRVALVRGPFLRPSGVYAWEYIHNHYPDFDVVAFSSNPERFDTSSLKMPVVKLHWLDGKFTLFGYSHFFSGVLRRLHLPPNILWGLGRMLDDFDIIHTSENFNFFSLQAALKSRGKKFCLAVGENIPYPLWQHSFLMWQVKSFLNRRADLITVSTDLGRRALIHEGAREDKIFILPGGAVDVDKFRPGPKSPEDLNLPTELRNTFNILFVGHVQEAKGVPWLIEAFESLSREYADMRLIIVGRDQLKPPYQDIAHRIKEHPAVIWPGFIPHQSMPAMFNLCDIFILPSIPITNLEEQFGLSLVEAMSCGKATIATNIGGIPHVVRDRETSLLIPDRSSQAIRDAIARLYRKPHLAQEMGGKARKLACRRYSRAAAGQRLYEIYSHLNL